MVILYADDDYNDIYAIDRFVALYRHTLYISNTAMK